jgi:LysR family nitrogen assimilation transcriptional regulator
VKLVDLLALDMILPSQHHGLRQRVERCAREIHSYLNVIIEMDSLAQIKELVTRGSGFWRIDAGCSEAFELVEFSPVPG